MRRLFRLREVHPDVPGDVDEEIAYHLERLAEDLVGRGMDRNEAMREARRRFGDMGAYRRALKHIDEGRLRMRARGEVLDALLGSVNLAMRRVRRSPGFAISIVVILAMGMGANSLMFGVVDRLLLSTPEHVMNPDRVRALYVRRETGEGIRVGRTLSYPDYIDFASVSGFSQVGAYSGRNSMTMGRGPEARRVTVNGVSASFFSLLGVRPALGRFFTPDEDAPGAAPTVVLSWEFWERAFGKDPGVLGRALDIGSEAWTVIGVAPRGFTGTDLGQVDLWLPLERAQETATGGSAWKDNRNWWWVRVVARLAPGASAAAAAAEATAAHRAGREPLIAQGRYDAHATILAASLVAARGPDPTAESRVARWLAGVSLIVLLIACFNVANLLLARAAGARREMGLRVTLGVSRGRLLADLLVESLVLAALAAAAALAVAAIGSGALHRVLFPDVLFTNGILSPRLMIFIGGVTLLTAFLAGVVPALHASRTDVAEALRGSGGGEGRARTRTRTSLLVAQTALSVVLLVGAGLFVRSLGRARGVDLGFDARHVVVASIQWNHELSVAERTALYRRAVERVRLLPGVRAAGLTFTVPFQSSVSLGRPRVPGLDSVPRPPGGGPYVNKVSSGFIEAMGMTVVEGRPFRATDDVDGAPPVAVVSRSMAQGIWPRGGAVGSCMYFDEDDDEPPCTLVIGVLADHHREELVEAEPAWLYYVNQDHPAFRGPPQGIMVGTSADATRMVSAAAAELRGIDPEVRFVSARSLQENVDPQLRSWALGASMFTVFGLLALVVAAWGLYSVLAFDVALRRRELGVRSALGAGTGRLVRLVLRRAVALATVAIAFGLAAALLGGRWVAPLLFRVSPVDPAVYLGVGGMLLVVGAVAGALPAWRAARVDPTTALREE